MLLARLWLSRARVIVSYRDQGLGDNLIAAATAWQYAKETGRGLVIVWSPSRYLSSKNENAFWRFFEFPSELEGVRVYAPPRVDALSRFLIARCYFFHAFIFPDPMLACLFGLHKASTWLGWRNLNARVLEKIQARIDLRKARLEEHVNARRDLPDALLVTSGCYYPRPGIEPFFNALQLREAQAAVDEFARMHFANRKVIGVHVRYHTRVMGESGHDRFWEKPDESLEMLLSGVQRLRERYMPNRAQVFLATDSLRVLNFFRTQIPEIVVFEKPFTLNETQELHEHLPVETAHAALVDMFLLARCDTLVRYPPGTWFSHYASLFVPTQETIA